MRFELRDLLEFEPEEYHDLDIHLDIFLDMPELEKESSSGLKSREDTIEETLLSTF